MIVASCRITRSAASEEEAAALGNRLGLGPGKVVSSGAVTLAAWPDHGASIDLRALIAWSGRLDCSAERVIADDAGGHDGTYSLVGVDRGGLLAARSLFGGRPLYYGVSRATHTVYACSRLAPLVWLLGGGLDIDVQRLAALAILRGAEDPHATVFRDVRRLLPGESIVLSARHGVARTSGATLRPPTTSRMSADDWADALRAEIDSAVFRATSGSHRPAVLTSGGLDSSALLAALVRPRDSARHPPRADAVALTLDFDARASDRPYFAALVASLPVDVVRVTPATCAHNAYAGMVIDGAPRPWPTTAMDVEILGRARALGADRVLSGVGGDFFWDFEIDSLGERAARGNVVSAVRDAVHLKAAYWLPTPWVRVRDLIVRPLMRSLLPRRARPLRLRRAMRAFNHPVWAGPALRRYLSGHVERSIERSERLRSRAARMTDLAGGATLADVADSLSQLDVYAGLVQSHVFLDVRLARFIATIPSEVVLAGGWLRGVLRMAFRDTWPRLIVERPDKGEFAPAVAIANEGVRASGELARLAEMHALGDLGVVEPAKFRDTFASAISGSGPDHDLTRAWPLLTLEAFASGASANESARQAARKTA